MERQGTSPDDLRKFVADRGIKYPVTQGGFGGYSAQGLPFVWVIGIEGKVIYAGRSDYVRKAEEEVAKIKYPGLGRNEIVQQLQRAAQQFSDGQLGQSLQAAQRELDGVQRRAERAERELTEDEAKIKDDAEFIIGRVTQRLDAMKAEIKEYEEAKRYHKAQAILENISTVFRGTDHAKEATDKIAEWRRDRDIRREVDAGNALDTLLERHKDDTADRFNAALDGFIRRHEGTQAAKDAEAARR
jgi:hypothetical protein